MPRLRLVRLLKIWWIFKAWFNSSYERRRRARSVASFTSATVSSVLLVAKIWAYSLVAGFLFGVVWIAFSDGIQVAGWVL